MIQQNVITSTSRPIEVQKTKITNYNTILAIAIILGITIILSLYVYQSSALYLTERAIYNSEQAYARQMRLNNEALALLAQTQSMENMVRRAQAMGYAPPTAEQIKYVYIEPSDNALVTINETSTRQ